MSVLLLFRPKNFYGEVAFSKKTIKIRLFYEGNKVTLHFGETFVFNLFFGFYDQFSILRMTKISSIVLLLLLKSN